MNSSNNPELLPSAQLDELLNDPAFALKDRLFDESEICKYIANFIPKTKVKAFGYTDVKSIYDRIKRIPYLAETVRRPLMLLITLHVLPYLEAYFIERKIETNDAKVLRIDLMHLFTCLVIEDSQRKANITLEVADKLKKELGMSISKCILDYNRYFAQHLDKCRLKEINEKKVFAADDRDEDMSLFKYLLSRENNAAVYDCEEAYLVCKYGREGSALLRCSGEPGDYTYKYVCDDFLDYFTNLTPQALEKRFGEIQKYLESKKFKIETVTTTLSVWSFSSHKQTPTKIQYPEPPIITDVKELLMKIKDGACLPYQRVYLINCLTDGFSVASEIAKVLKDDHCPFGLQIDLNSARLGSHGLGLIMNAMLKGKCPRKMRLNIGDNISNNERKHADVQTFIDLLSNDQCPQELDIDVSKNYHEISGIAQAMLTNTAVIGIKLDDFSKHHKEEHLETIKLCCQRNRLIYQYPELESYIKEISHKAGLYRTKLQATTINSQASSFIGANREVTPVSLTEELKEYLAALESRLRSSRPSNMAP